MRDCYKNGTGLLQAEIWAISRVNVGRTWNPYMFFPHEIRIAHWQPTWDPYETGGQKLYGEYMGGTVGKICGNCVQDLGPIWATHMGTI